MSPWRHSLSLALLISLSGCSFMPDYQRPESVIELNDSATVSSAAAHELGWQDFYHDAKLQQLIQLALDNNQNLRIASLSVQQLQQQYQIQRTERLPAVDVEGAISRSRTPSSLSNGSQSGIQEQYSVGLGVTAWEIDFFGRLDSLSQSALQQYLASQAGRDSIQLSLIAEVADA